MLEVYWASSRALTAFCKDSLTESVSLQDKGNIYKISHNNKKILLKLKLCIKLKIFDWFLYIVRYSVLSAEIKIYKSIQN